MSLEEHIEQVFMIDCSRCSNQQEAYRETIEEAGDQYADQGWTEEGSRVFCPSCSS